MIPFNAGDFAWTHDQYNLSNEKEFEKETQTPSGYQKALGAAAQMNFPGETNSVVTDELKVKGAWTHDQFDHMNERTWTEENKANYKTYSDIVDEHVKEAAAKAKTAAPATKTAAGAKTAAAGAAAAGGAKTAAAAPAAAGATAKAPAAAAAALAEIQWVGETNSIIEPYNQRDHAWNFD